VRIADQTSTTTRRTALFTHLVPLAYLLLVAWLGLVEGRPLAWGVELTKAVILYVCGGYILLTARGAEHIRKRTRDAIRVAREIDRTAPGSGPRAGKGPASAPRRGRAPRASSWPT